MAAILFPPSFQFLLRETLVWEAARHGLDLSIEEVDGSLFEPIALSGLQIVSTASLAGTETKVSILRADAEFAWKNLSRRRGTKWFRRLRVVGLEGELRFHAPPAGEPRAGAEISAEPDEARGGWLEKFMPEEIEVSRANLAFGREEDGLRVSGLAFTATGLGPGAVKIERIEVLQPWLRRTFLDVRGTTAMHESKLTVANLALDPDFIVKTFSTDLAGFADGGAKMEFDLTAFGGAIGGGLRNHGRIRRLLNFEASGRFSQISVASLGKFFNTKEKTAGTIKEGNFTFQGSPRDLAHATLTLRLDEAVDFQWGERRWTSLAGGATLVHNRVEIPELRLRQPHNELNLSGEMAIPAAPSKWWQQDFAFNIAAKIDSLAELAPLLDPGLALFGKNLENMAGKVAIDGSVRGQKSSFAGQLIVSGSRLWYGSAPLDDLHAAIKLEGNKWRFSNLEFVHGDDYFRGNGVIEPVFGDTFSIKSYAGRLRVVAADLSLYWPLLEPFVSWCEGGLVLDWSGESSPKVRTGFVHAQLKHFRSIAAPHRIDADLEATYAPQKIAFSNFTVSDADSAFSARVTAGPKTTRLDGIRLTQRNGMALEGDAIVPLDLWQAWQTGRWMDAVDFAGACKAELTAHQLQLHDALVLTGRQFPVKGLLDGNLVAAGTLSQPAFAGKAELRGVQCPLGEDLPLLENLDADLAFTGQEVSLLHGQARVAAGAAEFEGLIGVKNLRNPDLKMRVKMESAHPLSPLGPRADLLPDFDLAIDGKWDDARVQGSVRSSPESPSPRLNLAGLLDPATDFLAISIRTEPFCDWLFDLDWKNVEPVDFTSGTGRSLGKVRRDLRVTGRGWHLKSTGELRMDGVPLSSPFARFEIESGTIQFPVFGEPRISLRGSGTAPGCTFHAVVSGTPKHKLVALWSEPPMPAAVLLELILKGPKPAETRVNAAPAAPPIPLQPAVPAAAP